jgi:quinol monooxygenase YgiN/alkylhydroperoxidase family enzyme
MDTDQAQLAGVPLLDADQLPPVLRERLQPRIERLGYLGDFFRLAAHQPAALAAFIDFTEASRAALPGDLAEVVALTVATYARNDYERYQHEQLAVKLGLGPGWVRAVEQLDPGHQDLTPGQRATQAWVVTGLQDHGHGSHTALLGLVEAIGPAPAIGVVLLTGRYIAHATLVNSFGVQRPVPSIFDDIPNTSPSTTPSSGHRAGWTPSREGRSMIKLEELDSSTPFASQLQEPTGPVTLVNVFTAPEGEVDAVIEAWEEDARLMKAKPGYISAQLHRGTGTSRVLVNIAVWESTESLARAFASPDFQDTLRRYPDGTVASPHVVQKIGIPGVCVP